MTEQKRPMLSIKRKPKLYVNPKAAAPPPKPKQPPPEPLSREERMARNRANKLRRGQEAIASLIAHWPPLFSLEHPKPLKIAIAADIKARELELTRAKAGAALMFYTQTPVYQKAVYAGSSRFDLSGKPCGEITGKQKAHALKQLEKWRIEADAAASQGEEPTS